MQDKKRDVGWLYNSNWPHGAHGLCLPDSKLFYASGALIFHAVSSHDSFFPQRKIAGIKKRTSCDRLVHCATEFRLQAEGDEGRGSTGREGGKVRMKTVHSRVFAC